MVNYAKRAEYRRYIFFEARSVNAFKDHLKDIPQAFGLDIDEACRFFCIFV